MIFFKSVCSGNDFIHIELNENSRRGVVQKPSFIRKICDRKGGAGADGVVYFRERKKYVDFQIFNRDGVEAELSGNGMAGLASVLFFLNPSRRTIIFNTKIGKRKVGLIESSRNSFQLSVEIGKPDFQDIGFFPFLRPGQMKFNHDQIDFYPVSVGNPHAVICLESEIPEQKMHLMGKKLAEDSIFPRGTNVEIVWKTGHNRYGIFFYERGVGQTLSSSTGSAASFAALRRTNQIIDHLRIDVPGGQIKVYGTEEIFVENCCEIVYKGIFLP